MSCIWANKTAFTKRRNKVGATMSSWNPHRCQILFFGWYFDENRALFKLTDELERKTNFTPQKQLIKPYILFTERSLSSIHGFQPFASFTQNGEMYFLNTICTEYYCFLFNRSQLLCCSIALCPQIYWTISHCSL